jgi:hypothetical protein
MSNARGYAMWVAILASIIVWPASGLRAAPARPAAGPAPGTTAIDLDAYVDANNIRMCVSNLGMFGCQMDGPGLEYPKGGGRHCMYAAGIWIAAKVDGALRVAIGAYTPEYRPGCIYPDGTYDQDSEPRHRVFKLVRGDTLSPDYTDWPAVLGAPLDAKGRPLLTGEQTLWCVYHDANPAAHLAPEGTTAPLGIEVQQTVYAFGWPVAFGNVVFLEFTVINRLANTLDEACFGVFCDPDIGGYADDLVGCDPELDLGFAYNGTNSDEDYGAHPPALGMEFLRGPTGPDGVAQGMTAFCGYSNEEDPMSPGECYNCMMGLNVDGSAIIDPTTNRPTTFEMSGDPVAGTGWLDSDCDDRRFILTSGLFTMAPGDTQRVTIALVAARARGRINSVRTMKQLAVAAREAYEAHFAGQFLPAIEVASGEQGPKGPGGDNDLPVELGSPGRDLQLPADRRSLAVWPNPAYGQAAIRIIPSISWQYELMVIDTAGRVVRTLSAEHRSADGSTVTWDGLNDSGAPAPPGIYSVSISGAGQVSPAKIVLLR